MFRICFSIMTALFVPLHSTQAQKISLSFASATFTSEKGESVEADTATLTVPKLRGTNKGEQTLAVVRFRSRGATGSPIVYLSGGTGSGISAARGTRFGFFQSLRDLGDVITFDLRGAGRSQPRISCKPGEPIPIAVPMTYESLSALLRRNASACAADMRSAGIDLDGHDIGQIVEDIESLRISLRAPKIRLVGTSTGSQIGLEYVRRYPKRVERAVLLGIQAPDQALHSPAEQEALLGRLASRNAKSPTGQSSPDLVKTIRNVLDSLDARPRTVVLRRGRQPDSAIVSLGRFDAQLLVAATLGDRGLMKLLPQLFGLAARGDFTALAGFKMQAARGGITSPFEAIADCQTPISQGLETSIARESAVALLGKATLDFRETCGGWGVSPLDASYRAPVRSSVPTMLVSGTLDGRTPMSNAERTMRHLRNGTHVVVDGASHGDDLFIGTPEIGNTIRDFLAGRKPIARRIDLVLDVVQTSAPTTR